MTGDTVGSMGNSTKQSRTAPGREAGRLLQNPRSRESARELKDRVPEDVRREVDRVIEKNGEALRRLADH